MNGLEPPAYWLIPQRVEPLPYSAVYPPQSRMSPSMLMVSLDSITIPAMLGDSGENPLEEKKHTENQFPQPLCPLTGQLPR